MTAGAEPPAAAAARRGPPWVDLLLWSVFAVAALVRVAVVLDYESHHPLAERPVIDEASYERWALEIADGDWLGDEVFFQEPLYPYWLGLVYAVAGPDRTVVRLLQALLGALTCVGVAVLARRAFGSALAAAVAGFGLAVHPTHALMACLLLKPNLFVPLWTLLLILLVGRPGRDDERARRLLAVGVLGGLGALLRGNALILLPAVVLWPVVARLLRWPGTPLRTVRAVALVLVGVAAVLGPTALRNWWVGDVLALTTSGAGTNLYGGNNADNPYGRATEFDWVRGIPEHEAGDWEREAERRTGRDLDPGEVSSYWLGEVWRSVRQDPGLHASILWNKLRLTLGSYEVPDNHSYDWDEGFVATLRFLPPGWPLWGTLGLAGLLMFPFVRRDERRAEPLFLAVVAYVATIVLTVTSMRARLPVAVWLMPFAGAYLHAWLRPGRRALVLAACAVPAGLLSFAPLLTADERSEDLDERRFNLATYWLREGDPVRVEEARRVALDLEQRYPGTSRVMTLAAQLDAERAFELLEEQGAGGRAEAESLLEGALARLGRVVGEPSVNARERFRANAVAGTIHLRLGRGDSAARRFRAALEFDPTDPELRYGLANALFLVAEGLRGRGEDAAPAAREAAALLEALRDESRDAGQRQELARRLGEVRALLSP